MASTVKTKTCGLQTKSYDELFGAGNFKNQSEDQLYGAQIKITVIKQNPDGTRTRDLYTYYQYRWVAVIDATQATTQVYNTAAFLKTLTAGLLGGGGFVRTKNVAMHLPSSKEPTSF